MKTVQGLYQEWCKLPANLIHKAHQIGIVMNGLVLCEVLLEIETNKIIRKIISTDELNEANE